MTTHELAQKLLNLPDIHVMFKDSIGPREIGSIYSYTVSHDDAEMNGDCEDIVGEEVIVISVF